MSASDLSAANRRHDEWLAHLPVAPEEPQRASAADLGEQDFWSVIPKPHNSPVTSHLRDGQESIS